MFHIRSWHGIDGARLKRSRGGDSSTNHWKWGNDPWNYIFSRGCEQDWEGKWDN